MPERSLSEMLELLETLRARWSAEKIPFGPGATEEELAEFERRYSVRFPDDLRLYFRLLGGMSDWWMDDANFTFFPLRMVQSWSEVVGVEDCQLVSSMIEDPSRTFVIADFLISSHEYLIRMSKHGQSSPMIYYTPQFQQHPEYKHEVAPSFAAFLRLYLTNPDALF